MADELEAFERFWCEEGHKHLRPPGGEFPGGFNLLEVIRRELGECNRVLEVGCGDGRLSQAFYPGQYIGLDVNAKNITKAKLRFPEHEFILRVWPNPLYVYPHVDAILAVHLLLHIPDDLVRKFIRGFADAAPIVLVGEILGREWRRKGGKPPAWNRTVDDYMVLFRNTGYELVSHSRYSYKWYADKPEHADKNTDMSFLRFEQCSTG